MNVYILEDEIAKKDLVISDLQRRLANYEGPQAMKEKLVTQEPVFREGRDQFIVVFLSRIVTDQLQNLRCTNCGSLICQFSSKQVDAFIYGSEIPEEQNSVDIMCKRCKLIYRIV